MSRLSGPCCRPRTLEVRGEPPDDGQETPDQQQARISASSATRELDELMACLSDFKVPSGVCVSGELGRVCVCVCVSAVWPTAMFACFLSASLGFQKVFPYQHSAQGISWKYHRYWQIIGD